MRIQIRFNNSYFTEPIITENDGSTIPMTPQQARLKEFYIFRAFIS